MVNYGMLCGFYLLSDYDNYLFIVSVKISNVQTTFKVLVFADSLLTIQCLDWTSDINLMIFTFRLCVQTWQRLHWGYIHWVSYYNLEAYLGPYEKSLKASKVSKKAPKKLPKTAKSYLIVS